jgi:hypothetical protein
MYRGGHRRQGRPLTIAVALIVSSLAMVMVGGCGSNDAEDIATSTTAASSEPSGGSGSASEVAGKAMADKIFATYDEMNAKVVELANQKLEPAVLKPQLTELYDSYMPKMEQLKAEYLALEQSDTFAFQTCNRQITDGRGPRITEMENAMLEAIKYYYFELGDQETVDLLTKRHIELLRVATNNY